MVNDEEELDDNATEESDETGGNGKGCDDQTKCNNPKEAKRKRAFAKRMSLFKKGKSKKPAKEVPFGNYNVRTLGKDYTTGDTSNGGAGNIPKTSTKRLWSKP